VSDIIDAVEAGDVSKVASYLDGGPSLIEFQPYGETPLSVAVQQGKTAIVRLLLERGANLNHHGNNGRTPLHFAAVRGKEEIAEYLLRHQLDIESVDDQGYTPLFTAAKMGERGVAESIIRHGARYDIASAVCLGDTDRVKAIFAEDPLAITHTPFRDDLLTDAVLSNNLELVKLLLSQSDIDPKAIGSSGEPPLVASVSRSDFNPEIGFI